MEPVKEMVMAMTQEQRELVAKLKANCTLRGCPITAKIHNAVYTQYVRVLPGKKAQYIAPDDTIPVFKSQFLQILREEAIELGFTHVRGLAIDPTQWVSRIQEELHFPA